MARIYFGHTAPKIASEQSRHVFVYIVTTYKVTMYCNVIQKKITNTEL